ncbi:hypothetical protein NC01_05250 [Streptococcus uberis]|nr:hypothetical protein NC01_05250 [Streptococcus uberis]
MDCIEPLPEDTYLANIPAIASLVSSNGLSFEKAITFLVGDNGSGKSTLLEAIAVAMGLNPEGGSKHTIFETMGTHSQLGDLIKPIRIKYPQDSYFLRAESFYNLATYLSDIGDTFDSYGGIPLHRCSHGESFFNLVKYRFSANGFYLLDEPEAALSPSRLMSLMVMINQLCKEGCQFIIATHSPILITLPDAQILQLTESEIKAVNYWETEQYQLSKDFLDNPERMLKHLLD